MGEAGFSCSRCAGPMLGVAAGDYWCQACGERLHLAGFPLSEPIDVVCQPQDAAEVERWLRSYPDWVATLEGAGYYAVPTGGTRVQSNRAGRPTERTAILFMTLAAHCRVVGGWLEGLDQRDRVLADWYLRRVAVPVLARRLGITECQAREAVRRLPKRIWAAWYLTLDKVCAMI